MLTTTHTSGRGNTVCARPVLIVHLIATQTKIYVALFQGVSLHRDSGTNEYCIKPSCQSRIHKLILLIVIPSFYP